MSRFCLCRRKRRKRNALFPARWISWTSSKGLKIVPICNVADLKTDLALLQYTGGTTGIPKGAMISHYTLACASIGSMYWYRHREDDVHLGVTPFFHVMGQQQLMCTPLVSGGRVVILSRFVPDVVARAITHYRCTFWVGATTMVIALLSLPNIRGLRF